MMGKNKIWYQQQLPFQTFVRNLMIRFIKGSVATSVIGLSLICTYMARCIDQSLFVKDHETSRRFALSRWGCVYANFMMMPKSYFKYKYSISN